MIGKILNTALLGTHKLLLFKFIQFAPIAASIVLLMGQEFSTK